MAPNHWYCNGHAPVPTWATIYFCIWEIAIIPEFPELVYYQQYIDDGFGAWVPNPQVDNTACLTLFQQRMQSFSIEHEFFISNPDLRALQWTFSTLEKTAVILDLSISIDNGNVSTKIYETDLRRGAVRPSGRQLCTLRVRYRVEHPVPPPLVRDL